MLFLVALLTGALSAFAFAPVGLWPLMPLAIAALCELIWRSKSPQAGARRRLGVRARPVRRRPQLDRDRLYLSGGDAGLARLDRGRAAVALPRGLSGARGRPRLAVQGTSARLPLVLVLAGAWPITEWLRGTMFTGFPWNPLGVTLADTPLLNCGAVSSAPTDCRDPGCARRRRSAAGSWAQALRGPACVGFAVLFAVMYALPCAATRRCTWPEPIRVVQPNIGQEDKWREGFSEEAARRLAALSPKPGGRRPRLLFWPEAAVTDPLEDARTGEHQAHGPVRAHSRRGAGRARRLSADRRDRDLLEGRPLHRRRGQQRLRARPARAACSAATTRRIWCPTASICRCGLCCRRSACRGSRPATSTSTPARARARSTCRAGARSASSCATRSSSRARWSTARNRPDFIFNPSNDAWFGALGPAAAPRPGAAARGRGRHCRDPLDAHRHQRGDRRQRRASSQRFRWRTAGVIDAALPPRRRRRPCSPASAISSRLLLGVRSVDRRHCDGPHSPLGRAPYKDFLISHEDPHPLMRSSYLFTSESVSEGHPDKVADQISDAIVDLFLCKDPEARVACETMVTTQRIVIAARSAARMPMTRSYFPTPMAGRRARATRSSKSCATRSKRIGYEQAGFHWQTASFENHLHGQSAHIAQGVDAVGQQGRGRRRPGHHVRLRLSTRRPT